jgi:outer membrane protein assembly factor BamB
MSGAMQRHRRLSAASVAIATAAAATAITINAHVHAATSPQMWPTYHADNTRGGEDTVDGSMAGAHATWSTPVDGAVYAQPLLDGNTVIVATENDSLYGIDATWGGILWHVRVGTPVPLSSLPCGDIDPLGITGTPVLDTNSNTVYAVVERVASGGGVEHVMVAVDAGSGALKAQRNIDPAGMTTNVQQQRGALLLSNGNVYVPFGGLDGDCGNYYGWVVGSSESLSGNLLVFRTSSTRSGIWAPAGLSGGGAGNVYAATGNGSNISTCDSGNTVYKLSPSLAVLASFADPNCVTDNNNDTDMGSAGALLLPDGSVFVLGKQRTAYTLTQSSLALRSSLGNVCFSIGGDAYSNGRIFTSCLGGGTTALNYDSATGGLSVAWHGPSASNGPPIVAGGYVWVTGFDNATLYALDPNTGGVAMQFATPSMEHFTSPSAGGGRVFVGAGSNVLAFAGPNPVAGGPPPTQGYWTAASDGGVFSYGTAQFHGSMGGQHLNAPIVGVAATPSGNGYWLVASDGGIFTFGDARFYGSTGNRRLNAPVVGMAATPGGGGYWLVASDGGIFSFGDAHFYGSTGNIHLNAPVVGMAAAPHGGGYWLVASDGGVFTFGPGAQFHGSTGSIRLNQPMVGMAADPGGAGYWLVARDGGVFAFAAPFMGSTGDITLNAPNVGIASTADGGGYRMTAADGGNFCFGDAHYYGSTGNIRLNAPMVGIAATG